DREVTQSLVRRGNRSRRRSEELVERPHAVFAALGAVRVAQEVGLAAGGGLLPLLEVDLEELLARLERIGAVLEEALQLLGGLLEQAVLAEDVRLDEDLLHLR